ncbi:fimbria/pilus outer membrane usher protein [Intestinirhabdus alba]|jgi:outer membrane usher protein|uniref:Fimbria/pilus outer membrane usher protein n=1 Tax=Intestinirhabdus alba TaxID=2899544 RepID=A0A6L6IQN8_9ENTR|nr:fimbria/pilus outer membrane usher protein [Intestinirhabdus alba]MTH47113.1 fimbria/pilus outer membrane usher protein [Intestinirhabdus alba]
MRNALKPCIFVLPALGFSADAEDKFNLTLLEKNRGISHIDASAFNSGNDLLPGEYTLKVIINGEPVGNAQIEVKPYQDKIQPLFTCSRLASWGLAVHHCRKKAQPLANYIPQSSIDIDQGDNVLNVTVPQKYFSLPTAYDVASAEDWDNGINAAFTNYSLQYEYQTGAASPGQTLYGTLSNGINLAGFQLRNNGFLRWTNKEKSHYVSSASFIQHDVDSLRGTLTGGDFYTAGLFFTGLSLRGASLTSNTSMFSSAERNYVPIIVGVANSNATVIIKQNGFVLATRNVTPGPFTLKDIPASASAGDMEVTVHETSGAKRTFYQPYNSTDMLVPAGVLKYYLYTGKSRQEERSGSSLVEGDALYGLNSTFTLLGGVQYTDDYRNVAVGTGANIRHLGGIYALLNSSQRRAEQHGQKIKLGYSKYITRTNSYLFATLEHKRTPGYEEFNSVHHSTAGASMDMFRNRYSLQLSQHIGPGNAVLNYSRQEEWNGSASVTLRGNVNFTFSGWSAITSVGRQRIRGGVSENMFSINISVPFGKERNHYLTLNHSESNGSRTEQAAVSGTLLDEQQVSYNLNATKDKKNYEVDASAAWLGSRGLISGTVRQGTEGQHYSLGLEGAAIMHHHGITFGQPLGNSAALIHTDKVPGLKLENHQNIQTDAAGNAIAPNLVPYHYNEGSLYSDHSDQNLDVSSDIVLAAPRKGAIVEMSFAARYQQRQFIRVIDANRQPLAFGTVLYDAQNRNVGTVSQNGIALINNNDDGWPLHANDAEMRTRCVIENNLKQNSTLWRLQCN